MASSDEDACFRKTSNLNSWKHEGSLRLPLCKVLSLETLTEYYHNEIAQKKFKDMFFQDFTLIFKAKHFNLKSLRGTMSLIIKAIAMGLTIRFQVALVIKTLEEEN